MELGFNLVEQTKIVTAASELARNTVQHGGGGRVTIDAVEDFGAAASGSRSKTTARASPTSIAMKDGFTTAGGLGLGLSGARRLSNDFAIESAGKGTRVTITRWR